MKKWYQSKTLWINLLTTVAGLLVVMQGETYIMESYGGIVLAVIGMVNVALRLITKESIQ
jgi:hypothetical protein